VTEYASRSLVAQALKQAVQPLAAAGCDTPRLDAEVLLAHILGQDRAWLYAHPEYTLSPSQLSAYRSLVARRAQREPVAYLTGHKEFYGLDLIVTPDVLIPRPETEHLVDRAVHWLTTSASPWIIADVGTGSGAVAVTLAVHIPQAHIIAIDNSSAALTVARRNTVRHRVANRVHCVQGDLLTPLTRPLRLVVANLPYLRQAEVAAAPPEVALGEPRAALDGGPDGLATIRRLLALASKRLSSDGALLVEIGAGQRDEVLRLARHHLPTATVEIARDYAGRDRVLIVHSG
jgi:release factor glutamine methyltransferase